MIIFFSYKCNVMSRHSSFNEQPNTKICHGEHNTLLINIFIIFCKKNVWNAHHIHHISNRLKSVLHNSLNYNYLFDFFKLSIFKTNCSNSFRKNYHFWVGLHILKKWRATWITNTLTELFKVSIFLFKIYVRCCLKIVIFINS